MSRVTVWICGELKSEEGIWGFWGAFSSEERAIAACKTADFFIAPWEVDKPVPVDPTPWPGSYRPLAS